jgi:hypothetical protein
MIIKDNVPALHKEVAEFLAQDSAFSEYLQAFSVVNGSRHMISRIMFVKGGLKSFLNACRTEGSPIFIAKNAEATLCCTRLSSYLMDKMTEYNSQRPEGKNPIPFGSKIWVGSSLGLYFTVGHQDLESFFEEGRKLAQARFEQAMDADEHRYGEP